MRPTRTVCSRVGGKDREGPKPLGPSTDRRSEPLRHGPGDASEDPGLRIGIGSQAELLDLRLPKQSPRRAAAGPAGRLRLKRMNDVSTCTLWGRPRPASEENRRVRRHGAHGSSNFSRRPARRKWASPRPALVDPSIAGMGRISTGSRLRSATKGRRPGVSVESAARASSRRSITSRNSSSSKGEADVDDEGRRRSIWTGDDDVDTRRARARRRRGESPHSSSSPKVTPAS